MFQKITLENNHSYVECYSIPHNYGYKEHLTLDRINNDLGYYPDNCRWATYEEQNQNKKNNTINAGIARLIVHLVYSGLSHTEVARIFEVSRPTVSFIICEKTWVNHTSKILKL